MYGTVHRLKMSYERMLVLEYAWLFCSEPNIQILFVLISRVM